MQKKITKKKIIILAVLAISILVIFSLVKSCGSKGKKKLDFEKITKGEVKKTISVSGSLEVLDSYKILSKIPGVVSRVYADFNSNVSKGQLLAELNSVDFDQQLMKISAQLDSVKLELQVAKEELEAKKNMYKDNLISKKGMQESEFRLKSVQLKMKAIQVDYQHALSQRNSTRIHSPISGIVISRRVEENLPVVINLPLFEIAPNLKKMRLIINIDESDIGNIKKDQKVQFTVSAFPEKTFYGKINQVRINPVPKAGLITYESVVVCDNDELLLKPGMTVTATVIINQKEKVLRVPNQAFIANPDDSVDYGSEKKFIWIRSNALVGKTPLQRVEVKVGLVGDTYTEILKNVKENDEVLIKVTKTDKTGK